MSSAHTGIPERPSLAAFLDHWLAHVAWSRLRFRTARTYAGVVANIIVPVLGRRKVRSLTAAEIEKAGVVWEHAHVTQWMRRKAVELLRSALNEGVPLGLCKVNVARRMPSAARRGALGLARARCCETGSHGHTSRVCTKTLVPEPLFYGSTLWPAIWY